MIIPFPVVISVDDLRERVEAESAWAAKNAAEMMGESDAYVRGFIAGLKHSVILAEIPEHRIASMKRNKVVSISR